MTPNEVKQNIKTIPAAPTTAERIIGHVTSQNVFHADAPSVRAAAAVLGCACCQRALTMRTTTARLKMTWANMIPVIPELICWGSVARTAAATMTVGSTNGAVARPMTKR